MSELIWTILGFALLGVSGYMIGTRVIMPRFGSRWLSQRDRQRAIDRAEDVLRRTDLDDETRYQLLSRVNSLRARGAQGESWGNQVADRMTASEINDICDRLEG
jgi:hypothetical protein